MINRATLKTAGIFALVAGLMTAASMSTRLRAQPTLPLPFGTSTVVGTSSTQVIGTNPSRRSITLCNAASATNNAAVAPTPIVPVIGATGTGIQLAPGACYQAPTLTASGTSGGAGGAWNGIGAASGQSIIVLEW